VPPPKSDFDKEMTHLDAEIRRLEAEFNMFFAGRLPRPPAETRARVAALVKKHDQSFIRNTADRFRFESLQNRHAKFLELVERQMTNRELGRPTLGVKRTQEPPRPDPRDMEKKGGPIVVKFGANADPDADRVRDLYEKLAAAKQQVGEKPIARERFEALVRDQVAKLGADGAKVAFRIDTKNGKVSLTVKPETDV
jgi:hypothetical protein